MRTSFETDEKEVLQYYINKTVLPDDLNFDCISEHDKQDLMRQEDVTIELIVRPECNQKCEYCYVARYGSELYPLEERADNETILKNLRIFLNYVYNEKNIYIFHWEFFAGDLFYDNLYFDLLDVFYDILKEKQKVYPNVFSNNEGLILIPCNFSFIENKEKLERVELYIDKFRNELNWDLGFSVSTDGKYAIDTREQRTIADDYWDKLFQFSIKYPRVGFHPMIAVSNLKNSIENYEWWKAQCKNWFDGIPEKRPEYLPYWLPARNDEWTDEAIRLFIHLLDYMLKDRLAMCDNSLENLAYNLFGQMDNKYFLPPLRTPDLIRLPDCDPTARDTISCSLGGSTCITLNNLAFVPCHRLAYQQHRGGQFVVENDKITDIKPLNVSGYLSFKFLRLSAFPFCYNCEYMHLCRQPCLGASFESFGDPFLPCGSVCQMEKATINFLLLAYEKIGVLDKAKELGLLTNNQLSIMQQILTTIKSRGLTYEYYTRHM